MPKVRVDISGPLFQEAKRRKLLDEGIREGMRDLVARGEAIARQKFDQAGVPSGPFIRSIKGEVRPLRVGVIRSLDDRPIRTWLERGTRRGVKLRKGAGGFQSAKRQINTLQKAGFFEAEIARRLDG